MDLINFDIFLFIIFKERFHGKLHMRLRKLFLNCDLDTFFNINHHVKYLIKTSLFSQFDRKPRNPVDLT